MAKILIFYEDRPMMEIDSDQTPPAEHYPAYTIMYNGYHKDPWFLCEEWTFPHIYVWNRVHVSTVPKKFQTIALIYGG